MSKAVFLDKDGTLIENVPHNVDRTRIRLAPNAIDALLLLSGLDYELILVSNQPGVALGLFPPGALAAVEEHLDDLFLAHGFTLTDCYWCPHHPQGSVADYALTCTCRKPLPGLLHVAAREHDIDLPRSWLIGDILDDVEAGNRAGCRTILLDVGNETEWLRGPQRAPEYRAGDLLEAATYIMRNDGAAAAREAAR
ncbi:MAG TPA: HAD-IIIA family hydrolase [Usitatibacter sp.]|jgi:histidinol-phosphate phosphatase family protein|nr:HAD-IIIA family hydrolase [Usitatibacter sp.]